MIEPGFTPLTIFPKSLDFSPPHDFPNACHFDWFLPTYFRTCWGQGKNKAPWDPLLETLIWLYWAESFKSLCLANIAGHCEGQSGLAPPSTAESDVAQEKGSRRVVTSGKGKKLVETSEISGS